jgi:tetratricopeptide (TPR) repeat protein
LQALEQNTEAAKHYQTAIRLDPAFAEPHNNLGLLLQERGRLDAAIEHYRIALSLHPRLVPAHSNLGNALREQGAIDEAGAALRRAIEIRPDFADAHAGLAGVYIDLGDFDRASESIGRALTLSPAHPAAWAAIPATRKMTGADDDWLRTAQGLITQARPPLTGPLRAKLHYALGKYYDDTKQYDLAFRSYQQASALKRAADGPFDREGFTKLVEAMIRVYTPDFVNRAWAGASDSTLPVLVCGMPRSGTSLTEQIIASHPSAFGAGELHYFNREARAHRPEILGGQLDDPFLRAFAGGYEEHLRSFSKDARRIVDKMPNNFQWLGLFHIAFPNGKIIHARRHPIDTCLSIYFQNFRSAHAYGTDLDDLTFYYREYRRLMDHWRSVLPADRFLEIDYEALIEDQEGGSRRIIEFLGLPWDERCLDFHKTERKVGTASNWQVRQKLYKTSKERWRNYEKWVGPLRELAG